MDQQTHKKLVDAFQKIHDHATKNGLKKEGTGNYNKIFSLTQLLDLVDKAVKAEKMEFKMTFSSSQQTHVEEVKQQFVATTTSVVLLSIDGQDFSVPVVGTASDRNNAEFALGKALTYARRYWLLGMLGLGSEDIESDNPKNMKKELLQSIQATLKDLDEELGDKVIAKITTKYGTAQFDAMTVDRLQEIANTLDKLPKGENNG